MIINSEKYLNHNKSTESVFKKKKSIIIHTLKTFYVNAGLGLNAYSGKCVYEITYFYAVRNKLKLLIEIIFLGCADVF